MFAESIWGLDLGSTSVRVVRLARRGASFEITDVDRIDTYRDPVSSSAEELDAALRKALSIFRVNHRLGRRDRIGVAIPGLGFETFLVDLPPVATKRVNELVGYELKNRLENRGSEISSGFIQLPTPSINERRVLVGAGPSGLVGGYLDALQANEIQPDRMILSPVALVDALRTDGLDVREAVCVRAGPGLTDIVLCTRDGPETRTEPEGTLWISRVLRERHGLGAKEAEGERRSIEAREGNPQFAEVVDEYAQRLVAKIEAALLYHRGRHPGFSPNRILLTGEGARIVGVPEALQGRFAVPTETHNKWNRVAIAKHLFGRTLANDLSSFSVALGAAIDVASASTTTFSLIPPSTGKELARTGPALIAAVCALALGVFAADRFVAAASNETVEAAKLTTQIRERIQSAQALSAELDQSVVRATSANKVWQLSAEWNAWEKATARALETLDPSAIVLRCSWERGEREIVGTITLALPRTVNASGEPVARDFGSHVTTPLHVADFPEPKILAHRAVDKWTLDAPTSAAPTADLYQFELRVPVKAVEGGK
jgi:Tfp pilus assembly PilM family ATPase